MTRCYPTISDLILDLTGIFLPLPIFTFGFFLMLAFLAAAMVLKTELNRKHKEGLLSPVLKTEIRGQRVTVSELLLNGLAGFVIGFKILAVFFNYENFVSDPQGFLMSWEGNWPGGIVLAVVSAWLKYREKKKQELPQPIKETVAVLPGQMVGEITMVAAISGIIGAKLFSFFESPEDLRYFLENPAGNLFSGLTIYGGIILGTLSVAFYVHKKGMSVPVIADAVAPTLMLAYAVGRIGCQLSGDGDWGIVNNQPAPDWLPGWLWAFDYPNNVINEGVLIPGCVGHHCHRLAEPVYPTPVYETAIGLILFAGLMLVRKRLPVPGMLFGLYLMVNGVERYFIEKIRVNPRFHLGGWELSQAQIIAIGLVLAGAALFFGLWYKGKKTTEKPKQV